jgi:hypothetical protein
MGQRSALAVVLTAVVVVGAACTHRSSYDYPPPPSTLQESTTAPDTSGVQLAAVPGRTTTTIDTSPGQAHLSGVVQAPEGLVPGAIVHAERLVEDAVIPTDVATNPDGTWHMDNIKGGRYRVRAYRPPDLAQTDPQIFFLGGTENKTLNLQVQHFTGTTVTPVIAPNPPRVGQPANLGVQVTAVVVDPTGIVRATPQPDLAIELSGGGDWQLQSPAATTTGPNGEAVWRLTCGSPGAQPLTATVAGQPYPLNIPACQYPPPQPSAPAFSTTTTTSARG